MNVIDSKIVFQNEDNPSYVYNNALSHDFWFDRGISHDMKNNKYDVFALPYIYAKEDYFTYVLYNYGARYIYTLQTENTPSRDVNEQKNKIHRTQLIRTGVNLMVSFDPNQLIAVNQVDYNNHSLV